jgi:hypothetical protein
MDFCARVLFNHLKDFLTYSAMFPRCPAASIYVSGLLSSHLLYVCANSYLHKYPFWIKSGVPLLYRVLIDIIFILFS